MDLDFDFTEKRVIITAFFCMAFTIANLITVKIININFLGMETPAGVLIYPLVYVLTNVITKVYGEKTAHRTLILGIAVDVLFVCMTTLILFLPSPANYTGDSALHISYLMGNWVNARLTTIVNRSGSYSNVMNLIAIGTGELVDNIVFIGLAFLFVFPVWEIAIMIITHWLISLVWIVIAQPFTGKVVSWAEKGAPA